jgi:hypothetical protein
MPNTRRTRRFHARPTHSTTLIAILVAVFLLSLMVVPNPQGSTAIAAQVHPLAKYSSYWTPWNGNNNLDRTGSGCTLNVGSNPSLSMTTSGTVTGSGDWNPTPGSSCSPMWARGDAFAGAHACVGSCNGDFTPSANGLYQLTVNWTFSITVKVWAFCGNSGTGNNQPNYAEVNVTPYMAVYDYSQSEGWTMPNSYYPAIHLDSRDLPCTTSGSGTAAQQSVTLSQDVTTVGYGYFTTVNSYEIHGALDISFWQIATSSDASEAAFSQSGNQIATMNWISIV